MSNDSGDNEKDPQSHDVKILIPAVMGAEDEGQIRTRLGRYGLGKLFDVGGLLYRQSHRSHGLRARIVEARGIERVPESERENKHSIGLLLLWFSCV